MIEGAFLPGLAPAQSREGRCGGTSGERLWESNWLGWFDCLGIGGVEWSYGENLARVQLRPVSGSWRRDKSSCPHESMEERGLHSVDWRWPRPNPLLKRRRAGVRAGLPTGPAHATGGGAPSRRKRHLRRNRCAEAVEVAAWLYTGRADTGSLLRAGGRASTPGVR